ncbi:hypothetical protein [Bacillus sp. OV322]|nr:hypothetical protein [Bacillus sp. OV322]
MNSSAAAAVRKKKLKQDKERLYQEALRKHNVIINQLKKEVLK